MLPPLMLLLHGLVASPRIKRANTTATVLRARRGGKLPASKTQRQSYPLLFPPPHPPAHALLTPPLFPALWPPARGSRKLECADTCFKHARGYRRARRGGKVAGGGGVPETAWWKQKRDMCMCLSASSSSASSRRYPARCAHAAEHGRRSTRRRASEVGVRCGKGHARRGSKAPHVSYKASKRDSHHLLRSLCNLS